MTGNWRPYAASISTWWLLYLTIALRGRELTQSWKLVGGPMVPWYIVCASPQNTSVKSVGRCQLVSSWESSGCVGFPFSALALMWAGILGGRVGESCVRLAEALRIWEVKEKPRRRTRSSRKKSRNDRRACMFAYAYLYMVGGWSRGPCKDLCLPRPFMLCFEPSRELFFEFANIHVYFVKVSWKLDILNHHCTGLYNVI